MRLRCRIRDALTSIVCTKDTPACFKPLLHIVYSILLLATVYRTQNDAISSMTMHSQLYGKKNLREVAIELP